MWHVLSARSCVLLSTNEKFLVNEDVHVAVCFVRPCNLVIFKKIINKMLIRQGTEGPHLFGMLAWLSGAVPGTLLWSGNVGLKELYS